MFKNLPDVVIANIFKYNPRIIEYFLKKKIKVNWKIIYSTKHKKTNILPVYTIPRKSKNPWKNALINMEYVNQKFIYKSEVSGEKQKFKIIRNKLYASGVNDYGQLGLGIETKINKYKIVLDENNKIISNIKNICWNNFGSGVIILLKNGQIMASGQNRFCELGFGMHTSIKKFILVPHINNVVQVAFGCYNTFLLLKDGKIMVSGLQGLEENSTEMYMNFEYLNIENVVRMFMHQCNIIFLLENGKLMASGLNSFSWSGPNNKDRFSIEVIRDEFGKEINNCLDVFSNMLDMFILLQNGQIMACGSNDHGKLGVGHEEYQKMPQLIKSKEGKIINNVVKVFQKIQCSILLLSTGEIMICGKNTDGRFGLGNVINCLQFQLVTIMENISIKNIKKIFCGEKNIALLLKSGQIMISGNNFYKQISEKNVYGFIKFELIENIKNVNKVFFNLSNIILLLKNNKMMICGAYYNGTKNKIDIIEENYQFKFVKKNNPKFFKIPNFP